MVPSRRTWNLGATPSLRGLWRVGRVQEPKPGMARPAPASPAARPFPHTGQGRLRTGRGKDTLPGGEEDSTSRSAARPSLAQCRALSVDWPGPRSPHRLYLTVQVGGSLASGGAQACPGHQAQTPWYIGPWRPCPSFRRSW
ncbi:rCG39096 [Rattus norvegicus]|uniref:RCG39096 n=1 Tax=Rattus norvegicus TaxID=10116 RepID=A6JY24_RAT|nr:rCG39096 [Rattus norvegicus]